MNKTQVKSIIENCMPDEVYFLSGQSSVSRSFIEPDETYKSFVTALEKFIEVIMDTKKDIKIYNACSSEIFGSSLKPFDEESMVNPKSPYGTAKAYSISMTKKYRDKHNLFICNGILHNHESVLRPNHFVTQKIIRSTILISQKKQQKLILGNCDIYRDWGYANEYIQSMWKMMQLKDPQDFVIATGKVYSLKDFLEFAFGYFDLDYSKYVEIDKSLYRSNELYMSYGNNSKAKRLLEWEPTVFMPELIKILIEGCIIKK